MDELKVKENRRARAGKATLVVSVIFSLLSCILLYFYAVFVFEFIEGKLASTDGGDLNSGLQVLFGLVFAIIFGVATAVSSVVGGTSSFATMKLDNGRVRLTGKILFIINIIILALTVVSFIAILIMSKTGA